MRTDVAAVVLFLLASAMGCASAGGPVPRLVDGRRIEGRYVADEAYAAYLRGVTLESRGDLAAAGAAYEEAIHSDPDSAHLWTRVGAVRCRQTQTGRGGHEASPWDAFTRASELDPEFEQTWTERARCHLLKGDAESAARAARMAIALDPEQLEPVVLLASLHERAGRLEIARRWLDGLVARDPWSLEVQEIMLGFADRTHDVGRRAAAETALRSMTTLVDGRPLALSSGRARSGGERPSSIDVLPRIDRELMHDDLTSARRLAVMHHVSSGTVALRAAALGRDTIAREQAAMVLAADPGDASARIAAAVAADLARDDDALARALSAAPSSPGTISPLGSALYAELLARRVGKVAADVWRTAAGTVDASGDELTKAVLDRSSTSR